VISEELELSLQKAFKEAREAGHELMTVEHLLLALLDNGSAADVLRACAADIDELRKNLENFIKENTPTSPNKEHADAQPTLGFQRVIQRAIMHVSSSVGNKGEVTGANVLVALYGEKDSHAVYYLHQQKITRLDVVNYLSHGITKAGGASPTIRSSARPARPSGPGAPQQSRGGDKQKSPLELYTTNLNEAAQEGRIDPLIGRDKELERVIQVLCRRRKNNPLLVGEAGVGKTAIAEGLASRIVAGEVPDLLKGAIVYSLDMGALLAGTKYRGDFEQRLKTVLNALAEKDFTVLFIDEIHTLIGAGSASGGTLDASNLLKPALAASELKCMGATTYSEYRGIFEKDHALSRRFQKIDVVEPTVQETIQILRGLKEYYEEHHGARYTQSALTAAAELSSRHIGDRFLPDKAIDVIDEAGAALRLLPPSRQKKTINKTDIQNIVAQMARIPPQSVSTDDRKKLGTLERDLKTVVFGQDQAIDALAASIKMSRSGLGSPNKPIGSFLFSGPTGVGKTELARQLSFILGIELVRFDMSEYMERHTVSRLIGAPPGYVGFDQGGLLTEAITKHPHSVLLLDEIEKAHPDVYNILLQVMDHGTLTDNNGRQADFRNVILIMTTNAGAKAYSKVSIGFAQTTTQGDDMREIERAFTPEFRNRLDAIIPFNALGKEVILRVVDKFLLELEQQLAERRVEVSFSDALRSHLADTGFDPAMGARPMHRLIQDTIRRALADELLFGKLVSGGSVKVDVDDDDQVVLRFEDEETVETSKSKKGKQAKRKDAKDDDSDQDKVAVKDSPSDEASPALVNEEG